MKKFASMTLGILAAVALVVAVSGCGGAPKSDTDGASGTPQPTPNTAAPGTPAAPKAKESSMSSHYDQQEAAKGPESAAPTEGAQEMGAEPVAEEAVQAAVEGVKAAGEALTAENIVGTKWNAGGMSFSFEKDGVLKVNDQIPGTWSMDGTTLKVGAMGQEFSATIEGDKIMYDGTPLERAN